MALAQIEDREAASSVRSKLNQLINAANVGAFTAQVSTTAVSSTPYNVAAEDTVLIVDTTTEDITINLLAAVNSTPLYVRNIGANNVIVTPNGGEQINDQASLTLASGEKTHIISTGTAWYDI